DFDNLVMITALRPDGIAEGRERNVDAAVRSDGWHGPKTHVNGAGDLGRLTPAIAPVVSHAGEHQLVDENTSGAPVDLGPAVNRVAVTPGRQVVLVVVYFLRFVLTRTLTFGHPYRIGPGPAAIRGTRDNDITGGYVLTVDILGVLPGNLSDGCKVRCAVRIEA